MHPALIKWSYSLLKPYGRLEALFKDDLILLANIKNDPDLTDSV
jgi:hypothetical protein